MFKERVAATVELKDWLSPLGAEELEPKNWLPPPWRVSQCQGAPKDRGKVEPPVGDAFSQDVKYKAREEARRLEKRAREDYRE